MANETNDNHSRVQITFGAVKGADGWLPMTENNGRRVCNLHGAWDAIYTREVAVASARETAEAEAERYVGDWIVTVEAE